MRHKNIYSQFYVWVVFTLFTCLAFGQNEALFEKGNSFYNNGKYQEAIESYLQIAENGEHSAALYYNLGNSYYKLNQIAPSIYYYEKALLLDPDDQDVLNNLQFAKNMTIDAIDVMPQTGIDKLFENFIGRLSYNSWAILAIVGMILFVILFLLYYFAAFSTKKRIYFGLSVLLLIISVASFGFAYQQYDLEQGKRPAIIFSKETSIMSEPNMGSNEVFKLHEGTKVNVLEVLGEWNKIKLADGKIGWLPSSELKEIKDF
ncbi:tetratricopeptide repeat protein [Galbibacter mesophilus]|uniref:tetratricopeptide repeat protein n=1 Tax=Galbibacter mesophilus TaxID=379069 RepID=UPI00192005FC|nr:tetratricopeptide repeat protein [Galbibacter mesophilus]MCM5662085.1 tetratricopeptide repeat protein [Galbibacter mesophilus]